MNTKGRSPDIFNTSGIEAVHLLYALQSNVLFNRHYGPEDQFWSRQVRIRNKLAHIVRQHEDASLLANQLFKQRWHTWMESTGHGHNFLHTQTWKTKKQKEPQ